MIKPPVFLENRGLLKYYGCYGAAAPRLLLEEKLSAKLTDEVLPQYEFAEVQQ